MNQHLVCLAQKIGMDKSIAYSSGSRVVQGITGLVSVFFITTFLTGIEQGFYYTFGSILALQIFLELGLTGIMTQYVAHEASHLQLDENCQYVGEEKYKSRLASLVHFCVKWYFVLSIISFFFLAIIGYIFFSHYSDYDVNAVSWIIPWILVCLTTAINIFISPFVSILMGLGKVKEMSKIGFWQQVVLPITYWMGFALGLKLLVPGISSFISIIIWQIFIWKSGLGRILINLWNTKISEKVNYIKEIFPYQWKIAISWVSGYFIFQLFNPVLFATEGAVVAGQMGMTLQILNAIQAFSMSWLNTKVPLYSKLIALKDYLQLDKIFNKSLSQMVIICVFLLCSFFTIVWTLNITQLQFNGHILADRFLSCLPLLLMMIPVFLNQYTSSWATYLRCHKREPFLLISVCGGLADGLSTFICGKYFGLYGVTIGYCVLTILFFPWGFWIYKTKKQEWHR
jgi:O-antigen/teichoic acid export membrane protein